MPAPIDHRTVRVGDDIAVHLWAGSGPDRVDLPVLIAFHGCMDGGEVFGPLARSVADVCDVLAPDAPGHGDTPWRPDGPRGYQALVPAALATVDAAADLLGTGRPIVLLGHSMGVHAASRVAAARPELVRGVILDSPPTPSLRRRREVRWAVEGLQMLQSLSHDQRLDYLAEQVGWHGPEAELWARTKTQVDPELVRALGPWKHRLATIAGPIGCPVTLLVGREALSPLASRRLARLAARSAGRLTVVPLSANHNPYREDPAGFLAAVLNAVGSATPVPHDPLTTP